MTNPPSQSSPRPSQAGQKLRQRDPERFAQLQAEAQASYRGLRQFFYLSFAGSGFIGAFIFLMQLLAGKGVTETLPNLALQIGVIALMIALFRWEQRNSRKSSTGRSKD